MVKPRMTTVIAERDLEAILPDGKVETVTVQIGRPARDPNPGGDWYCPIRIRGMRKERVGSHFGVDSLQALQFALGMLDLEVRSFAGPCRLSWLGHSDLGLRPWTPKRAPKKIRTSKSGARRTARRRT